MPELTQGNEKLTFRNKISRSNIIRIALILFFLFFYYLTLSPLIEKTISEKLSALARNSTDIAINSLTPVFDIHVYAGEYNLTNNLYESEDISKTKFFTLDPRILAMNKFLKDFHSPMARYANVFVEEADKYGLDWRLVASISGVESAFGNLIPKDSNNAWGWRGIKSNEKGWSMFSSWEEGIKHVTQRLAEGYGTDLTPFDIEATYCPPCGENPQHLWANGVNNFANQLKYYVDNLENL
ncbi:MAG: hypothetical protein AB9915_02645 [Candidatus Dojkabacteria bacterium]